MRKTHSARKTDALGGLRKSLFPKERLGGLSTWELLFWNSVISSEFLLPYTNGLSFYAAAPLVEQTEAFQAVLVAKLKTGHRQAVCSFSFVTQMPWKVSVKRRKERHQRICSIFGNMCHYPKELRPDRAMGTSSRQCFKCLWVKL